jgi:hypothetical protein
MAVAVGSVAFEQSPGNEAVRVNLATQVLEATQNEYAVGAAVAGITMAIEGGASLLIASGLHQEQTNTLKRYLMSKKRFRKYMETDEDAEANNQLLQKVGNVGLALGVGPGIVMAKKHLKEKEPEFKRDVKRGLGWSALGATVSGGIGWLVGGGFQYAEKVGLETPAEYFVDYATDWKFWGILFAGGYGAKMIGTKVKQGFDHIRNRKSTDESEPSSPGSQ